MAYGMLLINDSSFTYVPSTGVLLATIPYFTRITTKSRLKRDCVLDIFLEREYIV